MKKDKKVKKNLKNSLTVIFGILLFAAGFLLSYFLFYHPETNPFENRVYLSKNSKYTFTNPLLDCGNNDFFFKTAAMRKGKVEDIIKKAKELNNIEHASVYFLGLNSGLWFGIKEDKEFTSASLIKLFVLMTYLKEAENDPELLNKELTFKGG